MPGGHNFTAHQQAVAMSSHGSHQMRHMMGMGMQAFPAAQYNPQDPFTASRFSSHLPGHMSPTGHMSPLSLSMQQQVLHPSFGSISAMSNSLPSRMMQSLPPGIPSQSQPLGNMAPMMDLSGPGRVLHVANINDKATTVPHLFNLFSLCGCIARIKYTTFPNCSLSPLFLTNFQVCFQKPNHRTHRIRVCCASCPRTARAPGRAPARQPPQAQRQQVSRHQHRLPQHARYGTGLHRTSQPSHTIRPLRSSLYACTV
jgi:hypothetical protein